MNSILVDTSVWIDHLRASNKALVSLLDAVQVCTHPLIIGELACGNLSRRAEILSALSALPQVAEVDHRETLGFIEAHRLMGKGIGWVDMYLLASAKLARMPLWTLDKRLHAVAVQLKIAAE